MRITLAIWILRLTGYLIGDAPLPRLTLTLKFSDTDPALAGIEDAAANLPPDWGSNVVGGSYEETLSGLHQTPIRVQGTFRLERAAVAAVLNPDPTPPPPPEDTP